MRIEAGPDGITAAEVYETLRLDDANPEEALEKKLFALRNALEMLRKSMNIQKKSLFSGFGIGVDFNTALVLENAGVEIVDEALKQLSKKRNRSVSQGPSD